MLRRIAASSCRLQALKDKRIGALERRVAHLTEENRIATERLESFRLVESMLSSKNEEVHRLSDSKQRLVEMIKSLQAPTPISGKVAGRILGKRRGCVY